MTGVAMLDEARLPPGAQREFTLAVRRLYLVAGPPSLRSLCIRPTDPEVAGGLAPISPHYVSRVLSGADLPTRAKLNSLVHRLRELALDVGLDVNELVQEINDAWFAARTAAERVPPPRAVGPAARVRPTTRGEPMSQHPEAEEFRRLRSLVGSEVSRLVPQSIEEQRGSRGNGDGSLRERSTLPLLTREHWIPPVPLDLGRVRLSYRRPPADTALASARRKAERYLPKIPGARLSTYSAAVDLLDRPPVFFDGPSFRLLDVRPGRDGVALDFTDGTYFDAFDTCEPLGFEAAKYFEATGGATISGPYREWLGDPFDLSRRCGVPGVNVLTIRRSGGQDTFYLHRRTGVATARNTVHVVPAGEFQPSADQGRPSSANLDLRETIIREYAEEFLGADDVVDPTARRAASDFTHSSDYARLKQSLQGGGADCRYLGIGLYPLTWKPEILVVCVFDGRLFDRVFSGMVREMTEGTLEGPAGRPLTEEDRLPGFRYALRGRRKGVFQGLSFDEATVTRYASSATTLPAARACLQLAWEHRGELGLNGRR